MVIGYHVKIGDWYNSFFLERPSKLDLSAKFIIERVLKGKAEVRVSRLEFKIIELPSKGQREL